MGSLRQKVACQIEKVQGAQEFTSSEPIRFKAGQSRTKISMQKEGLLPINVDHEIEKQPCH